MEDLPEMSYAMRPSIMTFDAAIEGKDEAFAPPAEMPIKRLAFTPYKPASAPMTNPEPEIQQEQDGGMSSAMSSVMSSDVMSSEVRDSCASDDMEMEEAASEAPLKAHMPCAAPVESIKVFLRVRPLSAENEEGGTMTVVDSTTIAFQAPEKLTGSVHLGRDLDLAAKKAEVAEQDKYRFTRVFGPETQQKSLFDETARPLVGELFEGHSGLLFAYGPTNSGKTFTIQGEDSGENAGLLPRTLDLLFERIAEQSARPDADKPEWTVWITYMEIYNENIFDLLADIGVKDKTKAGPPVVCKLRETNGNIHVKGLKEIQVFTIEDAKRVAVFGAQHRKVAGTMMNEVSSRSHAVFNMKLCRNRVGEKSDPFDPAQFHAKLSIVDLAGSERATKTRATNERLKEAANINVSLMNLGRCLEELRWNQHNTGKMLHVVPFRHSKLTRLFQDHFMNGSKIYMIVAANPRKSDFDEALHALRYGAVARDIVVKKTMDTRKPAAKRPAAVKPVEEPVAEHWEEVQVDDLVAELECMRTQMYELQAKNSQLEDKVRDEVSEEMMKQMESMEQAFLVRLEDERIATEQKLERKLHILSKEISRREERVSDEEALQLQVQLKFYQTRVEEMQKEHKSTLARLLPGASPSAIERIEDESIGKEQMQQRLTGLEAQVASMKVDLDKKEEALQAKIKQKDDVNKVLGEADSVIRQLEQRFKCAEEQNDRLREELAQGHSDLALAVETSEQLSGKVAAFEQDTGALRSQETAQGHSDLHSDLALAIETSEELHAKLAASTAQHDGLVAQVMALEQDQSALRTQVSSLEGDKVALQSKVTGLEEHKTSQISGLVEEQGAQASLATALQARCEELTTSLAAAEASCADADSARATAEASLLSAAAATAAAEAARDASFVVRTDAEARGAAAEEGMGKAEEGRAKAEEGRVAAEEQKEKAEGALVVAEAARAAAEAGRVAAEEAAARAVESAPTSTVAPAHVLVPSFQVEGLQQDDESASPAPRASTRSSLMPRVSLSQGGAKQARKSVAGKKRTKEQEIDECPLHLLAYMLPDDESYLKGSASSPSMGLRPVPLSPSAANVKANASSSMAPPMSISKAGSSSSKFKRLYSGTSADDADELSFLDAGGAGSNMVEATPVARRLRSRTSRAGNA